MMSEENKNKRILLSEGSSLSARQIITALGLAGYRVDVCTADGFCIGRFSRYVRKLHRLPAASDDPIGYMDQILDLLRREKFDVLLPTHEQAFLFAKYQDKISELTHIATSSFDSFLKVQSKTASARLFDEISLPQPEFMVVSEANQEPAWDKFPAYTKLAYGTAGQSVWRVESKGELHRLLERLADQSNEVLIQAQVQGELSQAQALFSRGVLVALHCTVQQAQGIGNSQSARLSVKHSEVRTHLEKLGQELKWHGPMAVDYLFDDQSGPSYIEVNPRLVEPMNAVYSGQNLAALTVELSIKGEVPVQPESESNVLSHSLLAVLLGDAERTSSRTRILSSLAAALTRTGCFRQSHEDLTPLIDPLSLIPLLTVLVQILVRPTAARSIAGKSIRQYSLPATGIEKILAK